MVKEIPNLFTYDEVMWIRSHAPEWRVEAGIHQGQIVPSTRKGLIAGIRNEGSFRWVFDRLLAHASALAKIPFNVIRLPSVQYTEYGDPGDHYNWHKDYTPTSIAGGERVLSVTVQLSDPTEYEGALLKFRGLFFNSKTASQSLGTVVYFGPKVVHRVTPLVRGKRLSLVGWFLK